MQFFFLLLFNVFLGAVLYLVISLKLERSATEFRQQRLRKEMDEIIKEFNVTAERNITLLEGKIRALRLLLEKTGDIPSLDITIEERETAPETERGGAEQRAGASVFVGPIEPGAKTSAHEGENNAGALIKKGLLILFDKVISIPLRKTGPAPRQEEFPVGNGRDGGAWEPEAAPKDVMAPGVNAIIEKDLGAPRTVSAVQPENKKLMTENDILEIVSMAEDRYQLVSLLSEKGCDIEDISRYSGMPAGEVRLVLNLSREAPGGPCSN